MSDKTEMVIHNNGTQESVGSFVRRTMFKGVPDDVLALTMLMANRYNLDPVARHLVVIEFKGKYQPYVTRDGLLHVAHESGQFDGITATYSVDDIGEYAEATVWRKDMSHPIVYRAYRKEYDTGRYTWASHPIAMTTKTAEVIALRRAFDVAVTAREEMDAVIEREEGNVVEAEYVPEPETSDDPPAQPKGKGSGERPLKADELARVYAYAKECSMTKKDALDALKVDRVDQYKATDPEALAYTLIDQWVLSLDEPDQPALLDEDAAGVTNYEEGA